MAMKKNFSRLKTEITLALFIKIIAIFMLWYFFFSSDHRPKINEEKVRDFILQSQQ